MASEFDACRGFSFVSLPREGGRALSDGLLEGGGAVAALRGGSCLGGTAGLPASLTVEFDEDVEDSRTGGNPSRLLSPFSLCLEVTGGLLRVGLCCVNRGVLVEVVAATAGEYDEAELGVGT